MVGLPGPRQGQRAGCCEEGKEKLQFLNQPTNCQVACCTHFVLLTSSGVTAGRTQPAGPIATATVSPTGSKTQHIYRREQALCIYVCVYVCVCMYVCMYVLYVLCVCMYCVYVCMYVLYVLCVCVCMYVCMCVCMYVSSMLSCFFTAVSHGTERNEK